MCGGRHFSYPAIIASLPPSRGDMGEVMRALLRVLGWLFLLALIVIGYGVYRIGFAKPFTMNQLANRQAIEFLIDSPQTLTAIGLIDGTLLDFHSGKLDKVGPEKLAHDYAVADKFLKQVKEFDRTKLKLQDQITYDILEDFYGTSLGYKKFDWLTSQGLYPISPMFGSQVGAVNFMLQVHTIKNAKTAKNYVKRLEAIGPQLDAITTDAKWQAGKGVVLPVSLLDKSLTGIKDTVAPKPADNPLVTNLIDKMSKLKDVDQAMKDTLKAQAIAAVETGIYPAFGRMTAALEAMRPVSATQTAGVSRLPDGAAYYAMSLKQMTTTDYTPDYVHQLGLKEIDRITAQMDTILKAQGLAKGTVSERMAALAKDPRFLYPDTDEGRAQILADYKKILGDMNARLPEYFEKLPKAQLEVKRVPLASEKGSAGAYYNGAAMDGSRPGVFYANLRDVKETPKWAMKTLAYHEGIPGHHFQISLAHEVKGLPLIRQQTLYTAYAEGWALYAERLASEMGMYKDDPFGDLGRLQAEIFRATRLVVDTGIHAEGWTREQAIAFMVGTTGMSETEVTSEVERYMALPGQACAYKVGQLKILELREKAKAALGDKFNIKAFHTVILGSSAVPLTELERLVDDWIAREKGKA